MDTKIFTGRLLAVLFAAMLLWPMAAQAVPTVNSQGKTESLQSAYGQVYCSSNIVGVTSQAGLSLTTPVLTLYNPKGSGIDLVLWKVGWVQPVAAAAAGLVELGFNTDPNATAVTGTLTTTKIANTNAGATASPTGQALLAATLPAAPTATMLLGCMLTGAITTVPSTDCHWTDLGGLVRIHPGGAVSGQTSTASGTAGIAFCFVWSEEGQLLAVLTMPALHTPDAGAPWRPRLSQLAAA